MKKTLSLLLAIFLMALSVVPAFALKSPSATPEYKIVITNTEGGKGSYTVKIVDDRTLVTVNAKADPGFKFDYWEIIGDYEIVEGTLDSKTLTVYADSDLEFIPYFLSKNGEDKKEPPKTDDGDVSPETGDYRYFVLFGIVTLVSLAGVYAVKLKKSTK